MRVEPCGEPPRPSRADARTRAALVVALLAAAVVSGCGKAPPPPSADPQPAPRVTAPGPQTPAAAPSDGDRDTGEDWTLPGTITPISTLAQLQAKFGAANVRESLLDGPEGAAYAALLIHPDDPARRLELGLASADRDAPIDQLRAALPATRWHDAAGVHPGMTLAELVRLNGAPVSFYGLGWDYGGTVQDWHGGKLANPHGAVLFRAVELGPRAGRERSAPQGDTIFESNDPARPALGDDLVVQRLTLSWPDNGER